MHDHARYPQAGNRHGDRLHAPLHSRRPGDPPAVSRHAARTTVEQVEEGLALAPKFDADGLIPCITTDANTGDVPMLGYMNSKALQRTIATRQARSTTSVGARRGKAICSMFRGVGTGGR